MMVDEWGTWKERIEEKAKSEEERTESFTLDSEGAAITEGVRNYPILEMVLRCCVVSIVIIIAVY